MTFIYLFQQNLPTLLKRLLTVQHLICYFSIAFSPSLLRHLPGRLKRWSILSTAPLASANSHLSPETRVYTLPANSNTLLPVIEVSFLESMHQYSDGRHHHKTVVPGKSSLPIPIVYRWLQPWMDYWKMHQSSALLTRPQQRCRVMQAMKEAGSHDKLFLFLVKKDLESEKLG